MKKLLTISDNVSVYLNLYQVNYFLLGQIWTESVEYMSFDNIGTFLLILN